MKNRIAFLLTAATLCGCSQSISDKFDAMCKFQKENDQQAYASSERACKNSKFLEIEQKEALLKAYEDLKEARAAVEASGGQ